MKIKDLQKNIPKDWRRLKILDVASVYSGATPKTSDGTCWNGNISWVTPKDLSRLDSRFISNTERKITDRGLKSCSAVLIPPNSLVMSSRAPIGYLAINKIPVATNQGCKSMAPNKDVDVEYLYYYLDKNIDLVKRLGTGSTFAEVGRSAVESVEVLVPTLSEQKKIAEVLSSVDEEIKKVEEIISTSIRLKNGLVEKLFSTSSSKINLSEVSSLITKGTTPTTYGHSFTDEGINFFKIENIDESGNIDLSSCKRISEKTHEFLKRSQLAVGDVLFSIAGALGRIAIIETFHLPANINQAIAIIRLKDKRDAGFISQVLKTDFVKKQVVGSSVQLAQANISLGKLGEITIPWPKMEERQKISSIIQSVDEKIAINKKIRSNLLLLKKGLMNDLFTGKVRTI